MPTTANPCAHAEPDSTGNPNPHARTLSPSNPQPGGHSHPHGDTGPVRRSPAFHGDVFAQTPRSFSVLACGDGGTDRR